MPEGLSLLMDRAYEGDQTRQLVLDLGMITVVAPSATECITGSTTAHFIRSATKSNGCSGGSKVSAASSPALKSSSSFLALLSSRLIQSSHDRGVIALLRDRALAPIPSRTSEMTSGI